jgi:Domain of unknown function (DUF4296)
MREFRNVMLAGIALVLAACGGPEAAIPKEQIPFDTMVVLMADIHVVEAKTNLSRAKGIEEGKQQLYNDYEQVFFNHSITQKQFEDNYKFYSANPPLFNRLFEKTLEELNRRQALEAK